MENFFHYVATTTLVGKECYVFSNGTINISRIKLRNWEYFYRITSVLPATEKDSNEKIDINHAMIRDEIFVVINTNLRYKTKIEIIFNKGKYSVITNNEKMTHANACDHYHYIDKHNDKIYINGADIIVFNGAKCISIYGLCFGEYLVASEFTVRLRQS